MIGRKEISLSFSILTCMAFAFFKNSDTIDHLLQYACVFLVTQFLELPILEAAQSYVKIRCSIADLVGFIWISLCTNI